MSSPFGHSIVVARLINTITSTTSHVLEAFYNLLLYSHKPKMVHFVVFESAQPSSTFALDQTYFKSLIPHLQISPGFVSYEGYTSPIDSNRGALISEFSDTEAISKWQAQPQHKEIQRKARERIYDDYRIRIGPEVSVSDISSEEVREEVEQEEAQGKGVVLIYSRNVQEGGTYSHSFAELVRTSGGSAIERLVDESVYVNEASGKKVWISGWSNLKDVNDVVGEMKRIEGDEVRVVKVERDYTKFKREDAPTKPQRAISP